MSSKTISATRICRVVNFLKQYLQVGSLCSSILNQHRNISHGGFQCETSRKPTHFIEWSKCNWFVFQNCRQLFKCCLFNTWPTEQCIHSSQQCFNVLHYWNVLAGVINSQIISMSNTVLLQQMWYKLRSRAATPLSFPSMMWTWPFYVYSFVCIKLVDSDDNWSAITSGQFHNSNEDCPIIHFFAWTEFSIQNQHFCDWNISTLIGNQSVIICATQIIHDVLLNNLIDAFHEFECVIFTPESKRGSPNGYVSLVPIISTCSD